ncbi:response regulator receiver protein [Labilithrix luteola]|uniref:Response regulator receiver protein n=1 Tax=Labilithrix luteola TaxID=1391654 RepID=A0A0K1Q254_9BACT|nr:response regulator [Labilithrix luteola]AKU99885.1 response regulator receiver protein [Labilithrix luteola]
MPALPESNETRRILVVDDSPLALEMVESALVEEGFGVDCAIDLTALEKFLIGSKHVLIVFDVQMPEAFGDDLAAMLHDTYGVTAPVVLFSTVADEELAERAKNANAAAWVSKGAGVEALVARIKSLLAETS